MMRLFARVIALGGIMFLCLAFLTPVSYGAWTGRLGTSYSITTGDFGDDTADGNIKITPSTLNADSNGEPVKAHLKVPLLDECVAAGVNLASVQLRIEDGTDFVPAQGVTGGDDDGSDSADKSKDKDQPDGKLHATITFPRADVIALLSAAGTVGDVELKVSGQAGTCAWSGTDSINFMAGDDETTTQNTLAPVDVPAETPTATPTPEPTNTPTPTPDPSERQAEPTPTVTPER
jgi:hypothetical protein